MVYKIITILILLNALGGGEGGVGGGGGGGQCILQKEGHYLEPKGR